mmetsp:Transcript_7670/g.23923  ORF Transcript_7670/g.23923 Transcript_7670/m.23923 type:complete len:223 (-) Transcript_7670:275-943(-)
MAIWKPYSMCELATTRYSRQRTRACEVNLRRSLFVLLLSRSTTMSNPSSSDTTSTSASAAFAAAAAAAAAFFLLFLGSFLPGVAPLLSAATAWSAAGGASESKPSARRRSWYACTSDISPACTLRCRTSSAVSAAAAASCSCFRFSCSSYSAPRSTTTAFLSISRNSRRNTWTLAAWSGTPSGCGIFTTRPFVGRHAGHCLSTLTRYSSSFPRRFSLFSGER